MLVGWNSKWVGSADVTGRTTARRWMVVVDQIRSDQIKSGIQTE